MNCKYSKKFKNYLEFLTNRLIPHMNHQEYTYTLQYEPTADPEDDNTLASCDPYDTKYFEYVITIYPPLFEEYKKKRYDYVSNTMLHELCHMVTGGIVGFAYKHIPNHLADEFTKIEEQQTQRLTKIVFDLLPKDWYLPKEMEKK